MRTIKFRGKRLDNNEWVYGFLYQLELLPYGGQGTMILTDDENIESDDIAPFNLAFRKGVDLFMVDPDTVGQFTGLQDANGTDIYEGDIVRYRPNNKVYQVVFKDGIFWGEGNNGCGAAAHFFPACEIIGNVFDNTELIEKGGKHE